MAIASTTPDISTRSRPMTREEKRVILASSAGTIFEWYDFYLYGSLAAVIAKQFFSSLNPASGFIFAFSRSRPASRCGRSARSSSDGSATSSAGSTRS